jgi:LPS-assembly protein
MNWTDRRQQLALSLCCGLAGVLAGGYAGEASAQAPVPLRVDPVFLGLPPAESDPPPAVATEPASGDGRVDSVEAQPMDVEAQPVEPAVVEAEPVMSTESSEPVVVPADVEPKTLEQPAAPSEQPEADVAPRTVRPIPKRSVEVLAAPSDEDGIPEEPRRPPIALPVRETVPSTVEAPPVRTSALVSSAPKVTALGSLRVDPALLGLPPATPTPTTQLAGRSGSSVSSSNAPSGTVRPSFAGVLPQEPAEERGDGESPDRGPALALRSASKMTSSPKDGEPRPVFLSALQMAGEVNTEFVAEGEAELRKIGSVINSDLMTYWPLEDEVEAEGSVRLQQGEDVVTGPKMRLRLEDQVGSFEQPFYYLKHRSLMSRKRASDHEESNRQLEKLGKASWNSGFAAPQAMAFVPGQTSFDEGIKLSTTTELHGEAERIDFEGENQYRLLNNTFTTCPVDNDAWYVKTSELKLDYDYSVGEGKDATVYFKDVPILYFPKFSFSLNNERKSGFLRPSFGTNSDNGFEFEQPYYWNIAPNMDATISPRVMTKRGVQLGSEFRYLNTALSGVYRGKVGFEYLPDDRLRDDSRHAFSLMHEQTTSNGFSGLINYTKVSDNDYYTNLSSDITGSSQTQLLQQGMLTYGGGGWWSASINFQQYQTLQSDKNNPVLEQYRMLPQITFNARKPDLYGADIELLGQYTHFTIKEREQYGMIFPDGNRTVLYPQISLPYVTPGWYVTPKFGVNYRDYSLSGNVAGTPDSMSVSLPVFSLDAGMTFERSSRWFGRDYTQTLEPRLYYVNIPHKDQSDIPLFDTALADFNFAQIFSENQFSGWDRINNANQLTAALTSRLIDPESGNEIMRAMIGERFYFTRNKVALSGNAVSSDDDKWERSDFLAGFSGQILPKVYADTAWQFDLNDRHTKRYSLGMRYQPEPGKVLNASYRYNRETTSPVNQVDVSGQWPLVGRWHGVGRLNYSFKDDGTVLSAGNRGGRVIESIAGLEYNGGCWILRGVVRRQALTSADASTSFFVQLELSDLGRIGSNPLNLLKRNIQGYGLIGDNASESVFGQ